MSSECEIQAASTEIANKTLFAHPIEQFGRFLQNSCANLYLCAKNPDHDENTLSEI
jgi:hypothetical protein